MARSTLSTAMRVGGDVGGVPDHVAVGEVEPGESMPAGPQRRCHGIRDLRRLHPWTLFEGDPVGGDLDVGLGPLVELPAPVAVPEVGHVPVFLGLAAGELRIPFRATGTPPDRAIDGGRRDEENAWESGNRRRTASSPRSGPSGGSRGRRPGELIHLEGLADLDRTISAEVEEDHACPVADRPGGRTALIDDDESREELVDRPRDLRPEGLDSLLRGSEGTGLCHGHARSSRVRRSASWPRSGPSS